MREKPDTAGRYLVLNSRMILRLEERKNDFASTGKFPKTICHSVRQPVSFYLSYIYIHLYVYNSMKSSFEEFSIENGLDTIDGETTKRQFNFVVLVAISS